MVVFVLFLFIFVEVGVVVFIINLWSVVKYIVIVSKKLNCLEKYSMMMKMIWKIDLKRREWFLLVFLFYVK